MPDTRQDPQDLQDAASTFWDEKPLLQKIVSIAPNILYVFNQQTQTNEFINSSLGASMGYAAEEISAMGAEFMPRICHPEDLPKIGEHFLKFRALQDGDVVNIEYRMKHKDGQWRWMLSHDTVFDRDENGDVLRLIGVATDITDRKAAEEDAYAQKRAADAANEELRSFAYSVSHDMKAPTNTLQLLLAEVLAQGQGALDEDSLELITLSMDMVHKMQTLVEDVLGYTRIVGSDAPFMEVDLAMMISDLQLSLAADIQAANAEVIVGEMPVVRGCPVQLRVYLQNMIGNALKYRHPEQATKVTIMDTTGPQDARFSIAISDNGLGIDPVNHERIFGMFKRLHLQQDIPGTGLGLALCQRVAVNHGGRIDLRSAVGEGSVFTIDLAKP